MAQARLQSFVFVARDDSPWLAMPDFRARLLALFALCVLVGAAPSQARVMLSNGVAMPLVSLGTAGFNDSFVESVVVAAVGAGFQGIDTAFNYYNEGGIGRALKRVNRSNVFVITKTSPCQHSQAPPPYNITNEHLCMDQTRKDIESNFQLLGVDYIDLLLLHGANHYGPGTCGDLACRLNAAQWAVYEEYFQKGKARAIGVSNFCVSCLESLMLTAHVTPAVNQLKYHAGMTADPEGLMSYCHNHGIVPMAYSPMGSGEMFKDPLLTRIGVSHGKTAAEVALKWIVAKGYPVATKTNDQQHFEEDLDLFSWDLSPGETEEVDTYSTPTGDKPSWACTAVATDGQLLV